MANSSSNQQQCSGNNGRMATHRAAEAAELHYRYIQIHTRRRTTAYGVKKTINSRYPVVKPHKVPNKRDGKENGTHKKATTPGIVPGTSYPVRVQAAC